MQWGSARGAKISRAGAAGAPHVDGGSPADEYPAAGGG
jgi:hypothetical protein